MPKTPIIEVHIPVRPSREALVELLYDATSLVMLDLWEVWLVARTEAQAHRVEKIMEEKGLDLIWDMPWEDYD
jgi:hypothetical protein